MPGTTGKTGMTSLYFVSMCENTLPWETIPSITITLAVRVPVPLL